MTGGQIAALIFGMILLIPGACSMIFGVMGISNDPPVGGDILFIGLAILTVAGGLFWIAFRERPVPPDAQRRKP